MRYTVAQVKNVRNLITIVEKLAKRPHGVPGVGVLWGETGFGKTTAAAYGVNRVNAVYVRAMATRSPSAMLEAILHELDEKRMSRCAAMANRIIEILATTNRPLFIDEADYLVDSKKLIETLRDLHDLSSVPLLLIGMRDFKRKVSHRKQLAGRVARWVEFGPADLEDARIASQALIDIEVADDLLQYALDQGCGSMRGLTVGLQLIEEAGQRKKLGRMTLADWGTKPLTFISQD